MVVFGVFMLVALLPLVALLMIISLEGVSDVQFQLRTIGGFVTLAVGSLVMAGIIGAVFLRTLLRPLQELMERTGEIEQGSQEAFRAMHHTGTREVATLADRFFRMARKLSDRSNYLTLFATHVSHELKTPLTGIQGAAELLRDGGDMEKGQRQRFLENIVEDATRLSILSTQLRELARADAALTGGRCDLQAVLKQAAAGAGLALEASQLGELRVAMSKDNALIVFQQLAENAKQHGAGTFRAELTEGVLSVGDDGEPIAPTHRDQLFVPFFTTRRDKGGTGMGLGIVSAMLRSHGGSIAVSESDAWKFELELPL